MNVLDIKVHIALTGMRVGIHYMLVYLMVTKTYFCTESSSCGYLLYIYTRYCLLYVKYFAPKFMNPLTVFNVFYSFTIAVDYFKQRYPESTIVFDISIVYIFVAFGAVLLNNLFVELVPLNIRIIFGKCVIKDLLKSLE